MMELRYEWVAGGLAVVAAGQQLAIYLIRRQAKKREELFQIVTENAADMIAASPPLARAIDAIVSGAFSPGDSHRFDELTKALRHADEYMVTADFEDYFATQRRVDALYRQKEAWAKACITNIAGMGWFSSDRAVRTYAAEIWHAPL